jgi:ribosome biogenesis SPOUT family RNA methylase Rps3
LGEIVFIIEHLEPVLSRWMLLEYRHASMLAGCERLVFTNVRKDEWREALKPLGRVVKESVAEAYRNARLLVLDPSAEKLLETRDFAEVDAVVIGGIMGDHPPRRRTWSMLTRRLEKPLPRSLGDKQLSIDGAVYVALQVFKGSELKDVELIEGVEVELEPLPGVRRVLRLPFAYPLVDGRPLLAPGLVQYLRRGLLYDEQRLLERS